MTPVEYLALVKVYEAHMERNALKVSDFRNAHFKRPDGRPWTIDDFIETSGSQKRRQAVGKTADEFAAARIAESRQVSKIAQGSFDEENLPPWARMTESEKAERAK